MTPGDRQGGGGSDFTARFWGVRGSVACPGPGTVKYGGNTSCVEVMCGDRRLIFDAGTGIRALGRGFAAAERGGLHDIFLSHCHLDHVLGLPFFPPVYNNNATVRLWAGNLAPAGGTEESIRRMMSYPLFPIDLDAARATLDFQDFLPGDRLDPCPDVVIRTAALQHPGGAVGYRVEFTGRSLAYVTDVELGQTPDPAVVDLVRNASLLILDTTYTEAELPAHVGWGHSAWQDGVRLANEAGVKTLCLFHHDPDRDDAFLDRMGAEAIAMRAGTLVAREGMVVTL